jgi:signal recognition particle GTPase
MDPATLAVAAAALFFSEALKEGGKGLGKGTATLASQFIQAIRNKFQQQEVGGLLKRAEADPSDRNQQKVTDELEAQLIEDGSFAEQLQALVSQLQAAGVDKQSIATDMTVEETLKAKSITQTHQGDGPVDQEILNRTQAKNIDIGDISQQA